MFSFFGKSKEKETISETLLVPDPDEASEWIGEECMVSIGNPEDLRKLYAEEQNRKFIMENAQSEGCACYYNKQYKRKYDPSCYLHDGHYEED